MPDNNVCRCGLPGSVPALIPRLHYGPPGPPVNFDVAIFAERDTEYVRAVGIKERDGETEKRRRRR